MRMATLTGLQASCCADALSEFRETDQGNRSDCGHGFVKRRSVDDTLSVSYELVDYDLCGRSRCPIETRGKPVHYLLDSVGDH